MALTETGANESLELRLSLVLATVGRTDEAARFLASLDRQGVDDIELVVVDQNEDDRLVPLLAPHRDRFIVRHLRSAPGLSRARNVGLRAATGDLLGFPDDDCWYPDGLLERVIGFFGTHPDVDGLTGRAFGDDGATGRYDAQEGEVRLSNLWERGISFTIFLRRRVVARVGAFDERLGVGAGTPWGSGEETDYLARAVEAGFRIRFDPAIAVGHPNPTASYDAAALDRARRYGMGWGHVLRRYAFPRRVVARSFARPLGGAAIAAATGRFAKAKYHLEVLRSRWRGFRAGGVD